MVAYVTNIIAIIIYGKYRTYNIVHTYIKCLSAEIRATYFSEVQKGRKRYELTVDIQ